MKHIRSIFIAALAILLLFLIKGMVSPDISFTLADGAEMSRKDVSAEWYADAVGKYRIMSLPWLLLNGLILGGWVFLGHKRVVLGTVAASVGLLVYILLNHLNGLGYTLSQSVSAVLMGQGLPIYGWNWFYLVALLALPFTAMGKVRER